MKYNSIMSKLFKIFICIFISIALFSCKNNTLPLPELEEGLRGQLGIDKNINEKTIDKYLNRQDSVYRDMRMLIDEANYEAIGGDSYLSGFVKGFEIVPYPYLVNVEGLPQEVGSTYTGVTLFTHNEDGTYTANYKESMTILESLFPKDKYIFLMCGGGGYAGMTKSMLVDLGWDANKIYNTGGYWYYQGNNKVETKFEENGETHYNFAIANYHDIDFSTLTLIHESGTDKLDPVNNETSFIQINTIEELNKLEEDKKTFALYVYLPGCASCASFLPIVNEFVQANQIDMYSVKLTDIYDYPNVVSDRISYTPSMFIFVDGQVVSYLDPGKESDLVYYQTLEGLSSWFSEYIDVEIIKSDTTNEIDDCNSGCSITE